MKSAIELVTGLVVIALFALAGDLIVIFARLPLPAPIVGMALFALLLALVPAMRRRVERAAMLLTGLLGALIVPPFLGLALFREELGAHAPAVLLVLIVTTPLTAIATGYAYRLLAGRSMR